MLLGIFVNIIKKSIYTNLYLSYNNIINLYMRGIYYE